MSSGPQGPIFLFALVKIVFKTVKYEASESTGFLVGQEEVCRCSTRDECQKMYIYALNMFLC